VIVIVQAEYAKEGIKFDNIEYADNQKCLDLIELSPIGIMAILNEEGRLPNTSDDTFSKKLHKNFGDKKNPHPFYGNFFLCRNIEWTFV
jgi:myosin-5